MTTITGIVPTWGTGFEQGFIDEATSAGTDIADLAISGTASSPTFTITADADGKFSVSGTTLKLAATLDPSVKTTHSCTIQATDSTGLVSGSYAVTIFDPDAPGHGWWHWAVAGIPATVTSLPADASASGFLQRIGASEARNDFGTDGYGGPCPPPGKPHRYVITVYALKGTDLRVAQGRPAPMFEHEIGTLTIGTARLTVTYGQ